MPWRGLRGAGPNVEMSRVAGLADYFRKAFFGKLEIVRIRQSGLPIPISRLGTGLFLGAAWRAPLLLDGSLD